MLTALVCLTGFLFIQFFAVNLPMLLVGYLLLGFPWGTFQTMTVSYAAEVCDNFPFDPPTFSLTHHRSCRFESDPSLRVTSTSVGSLVRSSLPVSTEVSLTTQPNGPTRSPLPFNGSGLFPSSSVSTWLQRVGVQSERSRKPLTIRPMVVDPKGTIRGCRASDQQASHRCRA
jgi:hypothetical protein